MCGWSRFSLELRRICVCVCVCPRRQVFEFDRLLLVLPKLPPRVVAPPEDITGRIGREIRNKPERKRRVVPKEERKKRKRRES